MRAVAHSIQVLQNERGQILSLSVMIVLKVKNYSYLHKISTVFHPHHSPAKREK